MDYIIITAVAVAFIYILYRRRKKKPSDAALPENSTKTYTGKDAELLEVLEILVAKLEILILRQEEKKDGTEGSP